MTPKETDPDFPVSVQESPAEAWVGGGLLQGWVEGRLEREGICIYTLMADFHCYTAETDTTL